MPGFFPKLAERTRTISKVMIMTKLLEKAFNEAAKLPEKEQDAFASWILEELAVERKWERTFTESGDVLAILADEALAEHRTGQTEALDPGSL
jgi:hypothetical protein